MKRWIERNLLIVVIAGMMLAAGGSRAMGQGLTNAPNIDTDSSKAYAGITQKENAQVPLDVTFTDQDGNEVPLSSFFNHGRPVVMQLGYYECPQLCSVISKKLLDTAKQTDLKPGKDFDFMFVSINPADDWRLAGLKRQSYLADYADPSTASGFHFLVGQQANIRELCNAVGFGYSQGESPGEYGTPPTPLFAHPAVVLILTPEGKVFRYLPMADFFPNTLQLSLVEASQNKVGSVLDHLEFLVCSFNAITGKYAATAMKLMRVSGALTTLILGGTLFWLFRRDVVRK
jgi:protein SCO1